MPTSIFFLHVVANKKGADSGGLARQKKAVVFSVSVAAIAGHADAIVTINLKYFPEKVLTQH